MKLDRRTLLPFAFLALPLLAGGCDGLAGEAESSPGAGLSPGPAAADLAGGGQPSPPRRTIRLRGRIGDSLTPEVARRFAQKAAARRLRLRLDAAAADQGAAFAALCAGEVDVVDASRPIGGAELGACEAAGLRVRGFEVARQAVVVGTRGERDVGADCLDRAQLQAAFGGGSEISTWDQLDPSFLPTRLLAAGPGPGSSELRLFAATALGIAEPDAGELRSGYRVIEDPLRLRRFLTRRPPGVLALFDFGFYLLAEDRIRPLEVAPVPGGGCVFPSGEAIAAGLYPLARTLRLYVTDQGLSRESLRRFLRFYVRRSEQLARGARLIAPLDELRRAQLEEIKRPRGGETG